MFDIEGEPGKLMLGDIEVSNTNKQRLAEQILNMGEKEDLIKALEEQGYGLENVGKLRHTIALMARGHKSISEERERAIKRLNDIWEDMGGEIFELSRDPEDIYPRRNSLTASVRRLGHSRKPKYPETESGAPEE